MEKNNPFYQKLLAKVLDFTLLYTTLCLTALAWPFSIEDTVYLYLFVVTPLLWIPLGIIFYLTWGSTPGGAIMGIAPRNSAGKMLNFKQALRLSFFLEKKDGIRWVPCGRSVGRFLSRLALCATFLLGVIFIKAVFQFPQEFERAFGEKGWVHYTSSEGNFSADFPAEPTINEKQLPIPQAKKTLDYSEYRLEHSDDIIYSVSVLELPRKWRIFSSSTILKAALSVLLDNVFDAELISKKLVPHGKHPALDFHIRENDQEIKGRLILVGEKLYKVEFSRHFNSKVENEGTAFIQSFQPNS